MLLLFLFARLISIPLSTIKLSHERIARFNNLDVKDETRMIAFFLAAICNLILFALMGEEVRSEVMLHLHQIALTCIAGIIMCEIAFIAVYITGIRRASQAATLHEGDSIIDGLSTLTPGFL